MSLVFALSQVIQADLDNFFGGGISKIALVTKREKRGDLSIIDFNEFSPFTPQRIFWITNVPPAEARGGHAHLKCSQFFAASGDLISIELDNGTAKATIDLDSQEFGLLVEPMFWANISFRSSSSLLLVLASMNYDPEDYIHDYSIFCELRLRIES
jgi:UDP-2-acetamido-3-amino-2,3-dideoxy-glucuronate N-acetyltransferase